MASPDRHESTQPLARPGNVVPNFASTAELRISDLHIAEVLGDTQPALSGMAAVLVGRENELRRLEESLAAAADGNGRLVAVSGETGVGKTGLLEQMAALCRSRGAMVVVGRGGDRRRSPRGPA